MKTLIPLTAIAALSAAGLSNAEPAYSAPSGYTTVPLVAGLNPIGINLSNPVSAAGKFETIAGTSLTDSNINFGTALAAGQPHTLRITGGPNAGASTVITSFSGNTIVTQDDLSTFVDDTDTYEIRKTVTVADAFGATNQAGLNPGNKNSTGADLVWVQTNAGFTKIYYNGTAGTGFGAIGVGWKNLTGGNTDASKTAIFYSDAIFVERKGAGPLSLTFTGNVLTDSSIVALEPGINYLNRILPVDLTLGASGLQNYLTQGNTNSSVADIIWVSTGTGGYNKYYYNGTAGAGFGAIGVGWKGITTGNSDQSGVNLSNGFLIQRKSGATSIVMAIPSGLDL